MNFYSGLCLPISFLLLCLKTRVQIVIAFGSLSLSNMMLAVGCETNAHLSIPSPLLVKDQRSQILVLGLLSLLRHD